MAESFVQVTEGSGKKLHTFQRTVGANTVEDEVVLLGESYMATYTARSGAAVSTADSHLMQLMAGASLPVRIRRIMVTPSARADTAFVDGLQVVRLTTAGTGGTVVTPQKFDNSDAAAGATAMVRPTAKGTESGILWEEHVVHPSSTSSSHPHVPLMDLRCGADLLSKPIIIPAGTANGIALKNTVAEASATVVVSILFVEVNF